MDQSLRSPFLRVLAATCLIPTLAAAPAQADGASLPQELSPRDPIVCGGSQNVVVRGRLIRADGDGVVIQGNCDVEIVDSHIVAGGVGVLVQGNGDAEIRNSVIEGGSAALVVAGNGDIEYRDCTLRGGAKVTGHGEIFDQGGNENLAGRYDTSDSDSDTDSDSEYDGDYDIDVGDDGTVQVGNIRIDDSGVTIGGDGGVRVDDSGVAVGGQKTVEVDGDSVTVGGKGGVEVDAGGVTVGGKSGVRVDASGVTVGGDGAIRIDPTGVVVGDGWRVGAGTVDSRTLIVDLGARREDGELRLNLEGDVLFDFGEASVRSDAAQSLAKVAQLIRAELEGKVHVIGHTDSVGDVAANQALSEARAISVMRWLNREERIPVEVMVGRGMGERSPIDYNVMPDGSDNPAGRARNRRVEIRFATRE